MSTRHDTSDIHSKTETRADRRARQRTAKRIAKRGPHLHDFTVAKKHVDGDNSTIYFIFKKELISLLPQKYATLVEEELPGQVCFTVDGEPCVEAIFCHNMFANIRKHMKQTRV